MAKYDPLNRHLRTQRLAEVPMTFSQIEQLIGTKLPPSAYRHRPWWANESSNHVHAKAWLDAGYQTEQVDMQSKKLVFKRTHTARPTGGMAEGQRRFKHEEGEQPVRHPMLGALKGLLIIDPGFDLTQPAMPEWADLIDDKSGSEKDM